MKNKSKLIIYQVFTRLFGNTNTNNIPWGTIAQNGVGKLEDFSPKALQEIKKLGVTHIWYTGILHHALVNDYTAFGISNDAPEIVKGRAGSPYAVKDYYAVNPDLAVDPKNSMAEFEALISRSHAADLKVIIDIIPNHVARNYEGKNNPKGVLDFGAEDNTFVEYHKNNNFYYIPDSVFEIPDGVVPLNGELGADYISKYTEKPAKWTGNGSRQAKPNQNDWYETVKINYGIAPNGTKDFPELPNGFEKLSYQEHVDFWQKVEVPNSWRKFKEIALFWLDKKVDGFRYDMAEMVPVEFWSYLNSAIKIANPQAILLAEVYNPAEYRNYIHLGKMDYLYDKVETYDTLKAIIRGHSWPDALSESKKNQEDIEHHLLQFLENHDEQRLAHADFAGTPQKGKPLMVVSATLSSAPVMLYFGQEVGEAALENAGFGTASRTTIFDYFGVPNHQRWMNNGLFDGGQLSKEEKSLRDFYVRLLNFTQKSSALMGDFEEIQGFNRANVYNYPIGVYAFLRWSKNQKIIVVSNFYGEEGYEFELLLPQYCLINWDLNEVTYALQEKLYGNYQTSLKIENSVGKIFIKIAASESFILEVIT